MNDTRARRSARAAAARAVAVCGLLAGVFLMHGLAAPACPGSGSTDTPASAMAHPPGDGAAAPTHATPATAAEGMVVAPLDGSPGHRVPDTGPAPGTPAVCESTSPPSAGAWLLALLLAAGMVAVAASAVTPQDLASRQRLRAPPRAGSALLLALCVSRT